MTIRLMIEITASRTANGKTALPTITRESKIAGPSVTTGFGLSVMVCINEERKAPASLAIARDHRGFLSSAHRIKRHGIVEGARILDLQPNGFVEFERAQVTLGIFVGTKDNLEHLAAHSQRDRLLKEGIGIALGRSAGAVLHVALGIDAARNMKAEIGAS